MNLTKVVGGVQSRRSSNVPPGARVRRSRRDSDRSVHVHFDAEMVRPAAAPGPQGRHRVDPGDAGAPLKTPCPASRALAGQGASGAP